ncbi:MAG: ribosome biogenesis GTPase Der [Actinobacteria bacterium]|uniref:GTPase Der n=1 Tax=freshwater metagenome TaxID=449393 RepID=A0A6J6PJ41_9ZZZZ|nr:ribosome biogenesis GTPase Der [Actinomycetota bacterium]
MAGIVVAIDGPSGSGKSSTAKSIAVRANWNYLDTGALYRAATWIALKENVSEGWEIISAIKKNPIIFSPNPKDPKVFCGEIEVTDEIRGARVTDNVSQISQNPELRAYLVDMQQTIINSSENGIVVEGRDIGTVVAPDADLKVFLYADLEARTMRRSAEEIKADPVADVAASLSNRDHLDSTRKISPLRPAHDALELDSTELDLKEVVDVIWEWLTRKNLLGLPKVAVIGRPNVGKSTLVNRIIGRREAIVEDTPGVTRDRVKYEAEWNGRRFILIDTGGWEVAPEGISEKITAGSEAAIAEADVVLFVIDAQVGALDEDESLVNLLRKSKKKVVVAANKVDGPSEEADAHALWNLGFGEPRFVSALHGRGSGDLLDFLVKELPEIGSEKSDDGYRRIALVGRPNVGKSSLLNILAGESRVIVDDAAGTTRDPVDELIEIGGSTWRFIDTAGIRKRAHQDSGTDYYASLRTATALERAEVAVVVLDASVPLTEQDLRIVSMVEEAGRGLVIVMNKWDLVDEDRQIQLDKELERNLERYPWAQRVNVSAKTGWHRDRLAPALRTAISSWEKRIPTSKLNSFLGALIAATPPPVRSGKQPKIRFATQAAICPPKFVVFASEFVETAYRRFIERRLREEFGFPGTPVEVVVKVKERE